MERIVGKGFTFDTFGGQTKPAPQSRNRAAVIDTVIAEAGGEGPTGMQAVANVIKNRADKAGTDPEEIVRAPHQFEGYGKKIDPKQRVVAEKIVNDVFDGKSADVTGGADHFHAGSVNPDWAKKMPKTAQIGGHAFYKSGDDKALGITRNKTAGTSSRPMKANWASTERLGDPASPDWQAKNLTTIEPVKGQRWTVYKPAAAAFDGLIKDLEARGYPVSSSGGFNYRNIRGSQKLSQHAFGTAIDINAATNPMLKGKLKTDLPDDIREIAAKHGLKWGGDFKSRPDPMHFEYVGGGGGGGGGVDPMTTASTGNTGVMRINVNKDTKFEPDSIGDFGGIKSFDPTERFKIAEVDPVQIEAQPNAEVNAQREAEGRPGLITMPASKYAKWKEKFDANQPGILSDVGGLLGSGAVGVTESVNELIKILPGGETIAGGISKLNEWATGKTTEQEIADAKKYYEGGLSVATKKARAKEWWDEKNGTFGSAWSDPRAYMSGAVESIPGTALTMLPGGLLMRGAATAAVAKGLAKGLTKEAAEIAGSKAAARTAMVAGGIGEGALAAGSTAKQVKDELAKLPQEVWDQSEAYQTLLKQGMKPEDAKLAVADDLATKSAILAGTVTGLVGGKGDYVLATILTKGLKGNIKQRILKGIGKEGAAEVLEESVQSATEQASTNLGVQGVDPSQSLSEGVANQAIGGAIAGGIMGGTMGGVVAPFSKDESGQPTPTPATGGTGGAQPATGGTQPPPAGGGGPGTQPAAGPSGGPAGGGAGVSGLSPAPATAHEAGQQAGLRTPGRKVGPLESSIEHGDAEARGVMNQAAIDNGAPPLGTQVTVDYGDGAPTFQGQISGYSVEGIPEVVDEDGEVHEVEADYLTFHMPSGTQNIDLAPGEFGPTPTGQTGPEPPSSGAASPAPDGTPPPAPPSPAGEPAAPTVESPTVGTVPGHTILDNSAFAPLVRHDKPHVIDLEAIRKVFSDPDTGRIDMPSYGTSLKEHLTAAINDGRPVTAIVKGQPIKIVRVAPNGLIAEDGTVLSPALPLLSTAADNDHFEIGPSSTPAAPPGAGAPAAAPSSDLSTPGAAAPSEKKKAKKPKAEAKPKEAKAKPAETTRDLTKWWDDELDNTGRKDVLKTAGIKRSPWTQWKNLPVNLRSKIAASVAEREAAGTMPAVQPSLPTGKTQATEAPAPVPTAPPAPSEAAPRFKKGDKVRLLDGRTATVVNDATKTYAGNRPDEHFTRLKVDGEKFEKTIGSGGLELVSTKTKEKDVALPPVQQMIAETGEAAITPIDPNNVPDPTNDKPLKDDPENTLVLIACSDTKLQTDIGEQLIDLYDGPFWKDLRARGQAIPPQNKFALSGKYGFVPTWMRAKPYNEKISKERVNELIERGVLDGAPTKQSGQKRAFGSSVSPYAHTVRRADMDNLEPYTQVIIHAPGVYQDGFNAIVTQLQEAGVIAKDAPVAATKGDIIKRRKQFNQFLRAATGVEEEAPAQTEASTAAPALTPAGPAKTEAYKPGQDKANYGKAGGVFPKPATTVDAAKGQELIPQKEADARVARWKQIARQLAKTRDNSAKVIISMFDASGSWSQPWRDAGYSVHQMDAKLGDDIFYGSPTATMDEIEEAIGQPGIHGVLAATPCTTFAASGARWWSGRHNVSDPDMVAKLFGPKAARYFDTPLEANTWMVHMTALWVEVAKPSFYVLENPIGRIGEMSGLPDPSMRFDPSDFGDPYTKRTQLWGEFDTGLPTAPVDPVEGSKVQSKLSSKDPNRSLTPEGFAYAFFIANDPEAKAMYEAQPELQEEEEAEPDFTAEDDVMFGVYELDLAEEAKDKKRATAAKKQIDAALKKIPAGKQDALLQKARAQSDKTRGIDAGIAEANAAAAAEAKVAAWAEEKIASDVKAGFETTQQVIHYASGTLESWRQNVDLARRVDAGEANMSDRNRAGLDADIARDQARTEALLHVLPPNQQDAARESIIRVADTRWQHGVFKDRPIPALEGFEERPYLEYPMAPRSEWYGDGTYEQAGGTMTSMTPDRFLAQARELEIDEVSRENIDELKRHMLDGKTLDPLKLTPDGKEDGRHRAIAARELGIEKVPVIDYRKAAAATAAETEAKGGRSREQVNSEFLDVYQRIVDSQFDPLALGKEVAGMKQFLADMETYPDIAENNKEMVSSVRMWIPQGESALRKHAAEQRDAAAKPRREVTEKAAAQLPEGISIGDTVQYTKNGKTFTAALVGTSQVGDVAWVRDKAGNEKAVVSSEIRKPAPKAPTKAERLRAQTDAQLADYFTPGNIVLGYNGYDRVVAYNREGNSWHVSVRSVVKHNGQWVENPQDKRTRTHSTMPDARKLAAGPHARAQAAPTRTIPRDASLQNNPTNGYTDLGIDNLTLKGPKGEAARDTVVERGKKTGKEYLVVLDQNGDVVANGEGNQDETGMNSRTWDLILSPNERLVIHHNHPQTGIAGGTNNSFSPADIAVAKEIGVGAIYAHAHEGDNVITYRVEWRPMAKARYAGWDGAQTRELIENIMQQVYDAMSEAARGNRPLHDFYTAQLSHIRNMALRDAGLIDYDAGGRPDTNLEAPEHELVRVAYNDAVSDFHATIKSAKGTVLDVGRAGGTRHPGELAQFHRTDEEKAKQAAQPGDQDGGPAPAQGKSRRKIDPGQGSLFASRDALPENGATPGPMPGARVRWLDTFLNRLPVTPTGGKNNNIVKVIDVGRAFFAEHMARVGRKLFPERNEEDYRHVHELARREMEAQMLEENSGIGWYGPDVQRALSMTARVFPSMADTQAHRDLYLMFAGIFSNGNNPEGAWMKAAEAIEYYLATGELPVQRRRPDGSAVEMKTFKSEKTGKMVTQPVGWSQRGGSNEKQLEMLKVLVAREGGLTEAFNWLTNPAQTRADINQLMSEAGYTSLRYKVGEVRAGGTEWGMIAFGDKLGRYTLGLMGLAEAETDTTVDLWFTRSYRRWTGRLFDAPLGDEGITAQPSPNDNGAERQAYFRLTGELSREFGVPIGDVQAALWFFEKRLWGAHGVATSQGTSSSGAERLLNRRGLDIGEGSGDASLPAVPQAGQRAPSREEGQAPGSLAGVGPTLSYLSDAAKDAFAKVGAAIMNPRSVPLKDAVKSAWTQATPAMLAAVYLNNLPDLSPRAVKAHVERYVAEKRKMDTFRNQMHQAADETVQKWRKYTKSGKDHAKDLALLMHDATKAGKDAAVAPSTAPNAVFDQEHIDLHARFNALPQQGQELYVEARDSYKKQHDLLEQLLVANIQKAHDIADRQKARRLAREIRAIQLNQTLTPADQATKIAKLQAAAALSAVKARGTRKRSVTQMRRALTASKVKPPYFPLGRFGQYFVSVRDQAGQLVFFSMDETPFAAKKTETLARRNFPGHTIETGKLASAASAADKVPKPSFIADIEALLPKNDPNTATIMDALWQRYLKDAMPEVSIRSREIHRRMIEGHSDDALRVFANHMFHAAHQMAKLKHGLELNDIVDEADLAAKETAQDQVMATDISDELRKRHGWVMNPVGAKWAQNLSKFSFAWFLAASPAAALVNLGQTPMVGIPIIGARFGSLSKAAGALASAAKHALVRNDPSLTADERQALKDMIEMGVIDNTQSHDLHGVGEEGVSYNPLQSRVMETIGAWFHNAEVWNRRVTALAIYRLARAEGQSHANATATASDLTWRTHFDYSNSSRPRLVQKPIAKVLMAMRAYQMNMLYRLGRDIHQSFKGATPAERKEARLQLAGVLGMQAFVAGAGGVAGYNAAFGIMGVVNAMWGAIFGGDDDEDDPFTLQEKFRDAVMSTLGPYLGGALMNGVIGTVTGVDLANRVGMPDLWFRSPNKDLEGAEETWMYYAMQTLGAPLSMVQQGAHGLDQVREGNYWRGMETLLPKGVKDVAKSYRYMTEGLQSPDGDVIMDNVGAWAVIAQSMGFTPANVAEQWDKSSSLKNAEARIKINRQAYINGFAMAVKMEDQEMRENALERIREFNASPYGRTMPIKSSSLKASIKNRAVAAVKRERGGGVYISNDALRQQLQLGLPSYTQ